MNEKNMARKHMGSSIWLILFTLDAVIKNVDLNFNTIFFSAGCLGVG